MQTLTKTVADQAAGLRRLMARDRGRLVAIVGCEPRAGATSTTLDLAMALWQQGQDVLVLDEHGGPRSASAACSVPARATWADVAAGRAAVTPASGRAWGALPVLAARPEHTPADADPRRVLPGRVTLVDAKMDAQGLLSPLAQQADDILVVLQPQLASLKSAYACIKALHRAHAALQVRVLLTRAEATAQAQHITRNLVDTGSRYLAVSVQPAGCIPADPCLPQAHGLGLGIVQAFPTARAATELRRIAAELLHWPLRDAHPLAAAA